MYSTNAIDKIKSRKSLKWDEENNGRKGDKRNKTERNRDHKRSFDSVE